MLGVIGVSLRNSPKATVNSANEEAIRCGPGQAHHASAEGAGNSKHAKRMTHVPRLSVRIFSRLYPRRREMADALFRHDALMNHRAFVFDFDCAFSLAVLIHVSAVAFANSPTRL